MYGTNGLKVAVHLCSGNHGIHYIGFNLFYGLWFFGYDDEGTKKRELRITWHGCPKTPWDGWKWGRCQSDAKDVSLGVVKQKRPPLDKSDLIGVGFS